MFSHVFITVFLSQGERIWPRLQGDQPPSDGSALKLREFDWTSKSQNQLNAEQIRAISCIVHRTHGSAPMVVFGPPGTGKTLTLVEAVVQVLATDPDARILCTGPSDSSADTFAERLVAVGLEGHAASPRLTKEKLVRINSPQRLGGMSAVRTDLLPYCPMVDGRFVVPHAQTLAQCDIVVSTCAGAGLLHTALVNDIGVDGFTDLRERKGSGHHFTHIFVDEASQAMEPESLVALALGGASTSIVMAGDHKQLGVSVRSLAATALELSLMERLISRPLYQTQLEQQRNPSFPDECVDLCVVKLLNNYRSHEAILEISSELFYDGELRACANPVETDSLCT